MVIVSRKHTENNSASSMNFHVATFCEKMRNLGYIVSKELYVALCNEPVGDAKLGPLLSMAKAIGGKWGKRTLYPNFPKQVMEASNAQWLVKRPCSLLVVWNLDPGVRRREASEARGGECQTVIGAAPMDDLKQYFFKLLSSKSSLPRSLIEFFELRSGRLLVESLVTWRVKVKVSTNA